MELAAVTEIQAPKIRLQASQAMTTHRPASRDSEMMEALTPLGYLGEAHIGELAAPFEVDVLQRGYVGQCLETHVSQTHAPREG